MSPSSRIRRQTDARLRIILVASARIGGALLLIISAWLSSARAQEARPTLYVFLQLDVKPSVLEQTLQKQLPAIAVTVFGRFRDFQDVVATKRPDAILTIPPLLDLDHTKPTLQGVTPAQIRDAVASISDPNGMRVIPMVDSLEGGVLQVAAGKAIHYDGASGTCDFNAAGDLFPPLVHWKVENQQFVELEAYNCSDAQPLCPKVN